MCRYVSLSNSISYTYHADDISIFFFFFFPFKLALFTSKKVEAFEELTWDYGIDFDDDKHPGGAFQCLCGSRYCRGRKRHRNRGKAAVRRSS